MAPVQGQLFGILTSLPCHNALKTSFWILGLTVRVNSSARDGLIEWDVHRLEIMLETL